MAGHADATSTAVTDDNASADLDDDGVALPSDGASAIAEDEDAGDSAEIGAAATVTVGSDEDTPVSATGRTRAPMRAALVLNLTIVAVLGCLVGVMGYRTYRTHEVQQERELFVQVARQGALNLTTIDYTHADADVARILDSATGTFYDDFKQRSQPFVEVVKQAQSKSEGTVIDAGLESVTGGGAQVFVAVKVTTTLAGVPQPKPRGWRMRVSVTKVSDHAVKVSNVAFVP